MESVDSFATPSATSRPPNSNGYQRIRQAHLGAQGLLRVSLWGKPRHACLGRRGPRLIESRAPTITPEPSRMQPLSVTSNARSHRGFAQLRPAS